MADYNLQQRIAFDLNEDERTKTYLLDLAVANSLSTHQVELPMGNLLAVSASNHMIKLYKKDTLQYHGHLIGHEAQITGLQFQSTNHNILWSGSEDATLRCWDTRLPQKAAMVRGIHGKHNMAFCSLAVNPLDTILAAGTIFEEEESTVILWDIRSYQEIARFTEAHSDDITQMTFNWLRPQQLVTGSMDGLVCVFNIQSLSEEKALISVLNAESSVAHLGMFGPENDFVYALTHSETFGLWNAIEGTQHARLLGVREAIKEKYQLEVDYFVDCSFDAKSDRLYVLGGTHQGDLIVFNAGVEGFAPVFMLKGGHTSTIRCVHWDHQAETLLTGSEDGFLCHWSKHSINGQSSELTSEKLKVSAFSEKRARHRKELMPY